MLKKLMKGILPGNLFVKATIGTGDPTTTGYVLALAGILTAKFGNDIQQILMFSVKSLGMSLGKQKPSVQSS